MSEARGAAVAPESAPVVALGAGRMGRGIALVFAYAGWPVRILDFKPRASDAFAALREEIGRELRATLADLAACGLFDATAIDTILARVTVVPEAGAPDALRDAALVFEGVPEVPAMKREALARASALAPAAIIASTTSTILVDELAPAVASPGRFLNAHWLNPAFLMPLVELSPGRDTEPAVVARLKAMLESVGKVPVVCAARPGYIVPRIQTLAMNEAARIVEEGVATAEDVDKAVRYGFGLRFGVLGLLEFIDWGGGDILFHASRYLVGALGHERYAAPDVIERNMERGDIGLRTGRGFLDYAGLDRDAYRLARLRAFAERLRAEGLARPPVLDAPERAA
ncbi:3-hydroxybutyryl-CoA dehydrogenase [Roseomonas sp. NAR14]|uniref:L-gulonate 3-dehydrogenase n=1 Tax=Roseomonas acroporae TaxID=2937791 RepID=A0A9X1YBK4_9PROT|nr:3-hydroxybutyryl-CoA dehydrogenase [Roseomonas acroporae]